LVKEERVNTKKVMALKLKNQKDIVVKEDNNILER
jgi:hypothetical protein